jgi:hypothetical protein
MKYLSTILRLASSPKRQQPLYKAYLVHLYYT